MPDFLDDIQVSIFIGAVTSEACYTVTGKLCRWRISRMVELWGIQSEVDCVIVHWHMYSSLGARATHEGYSLS